jgi:hypothetical protein
MINLRVQRLYLIKRSRELLADRNAVAQELQAAPSEDLRRKLTGITLSLKNIQSSIEALAEKELKDGLSKCVVSQDAVDGWEERVVCGCCGIRDDWISRSERAGGNTRSILRWFTHAILRCAWESIIFRVYGCDLCISRITCRCGVQQDADGSRTRE